MGITNKSLKTLLNHIDSCELVLPEIQRDFVWSKKHVLLLFDSLYRGLPIGYMLVWQANIAVAQKRFDAKKNMKIGQAIEKFYGYLLDGQQRLTAIKLVRDRDEDYPLVFALEPLDKKNPDLERFHYRAPWNNNPLYVPVTDVICDEVKPLQILDHLKQYEGFDYDNDGEKVLASLTKLKAIMDYEVGIIEFEDHNYRKATELFIRFNSTGKKLNRSDLAAAELALTVPTLVSKGINQVSNKFSPQFNFTKPFLIQCLAAVHTSKMNFAKPRDIWDGSDEKSLKNSWKKTEKGIGRTIELLTGTIQWDSINWLPSINSIIPLVYLLSQDKFNMNGRINARKWLLTANLFAVFSGAVHSELDRILKGLKHDPTVEKLWNLTKRHFYKIKAEHFDSRRKTGSAMAFFISMIRNYNAKDWELNTSLGGDVIGHNAQLQVHHFFPQALLQRKGYSSELINTLANYVILSKDSNLKFGSKEPAEYIKEFGIKRKDLKSQCIPLKKDLWTVDRYRDFLNERRRLLAKQANFFLKG